MKKSDIVQLYNTIQQLKTLKSNAKFSYALAKNQKLILPEIESIQEVEKESLSIIQKFDSERNALVKKYGQPIEGKDNQFHIPKESENFQMFVSEFEDLKLNYQKEIEEYEAYQKELQVILGENIELQLYKIDVDSIPGDITPDQIYIFMECGIVD